MAEKSEARYPLRVSYEHASEGTRQSASGSDLSLGGIFIETASALPVGALLGLDIESGTTKVSLDARVLSRRADEADRPGGFAVRFLDLPNDAAASLHFIMSTRAPRKGTMLGLGEAEDDIPAGWAVLGFTRLFETPRMRFHQQRECFRQNSCTGLRVRSDGLKTVFG